jgi:hypothetical protein
MSAVDSLELVLSDRRGPQLVEMRGYRVGQGKFQISEKIKKIHLLDVPDLEVFPKPAPYQKAPT